MFDIGWSELLIVAVVAIIVVGPKELPRMLRSLGKIVSKVKSTANEFRSQFDDAMRESELSELRADLQNQVSDINPMNDIKDSLEDGLDPFDEGDKNSISRPPKKKKKSKKKKITKTDEDLDKTGDVSRNSAPEVMETADVPILDEVAQDTADVRSVNDKG